MGAIRNGNDRIYLEIGKSGAFRSTADLLVIHDLFDRHNHFLGGTGKNLYISPYRLGKELHIADRVSAMRMQDANVRHQRPARDHLLASKRAIDDAGRIGM